MIVTVALYQSPPQPLIPPAVTLYSFNCFLYLQISIITVTVFLTCVNIWNDLTSNSVQFSHSGATPWTAVCQASLSITNSWSLLKLTYIELDVHPTISSSVVPFCSCLQSFPPSGSFPMSQFCISGGQSIGASASPSVLLVKIQDWFPLGLTGLISLLS